MESLSFLRLELGKIITSRWGRWSAPAKIPTGAPLKQSKFGRPTSVEAQDVTEFVSFQLAEDLIQTSVRSRCSDTRTRTPDRFSGLGPTAPLRWSTDHAQLSSKTRTPFISFTVAWIGQRQSIRLRSIAKPRKTLMVGSGLVHSGTEHMKAAHFDFALHRIRADARRGSYNECVFAKFNNYHTPFRRLHVG